MGQQGGEYEPRDSRNVTGTSSSQTGDRWSAEAQAGKTPDAAGNSASAYGRAEDEPSSEDAAEGEREILFEPDPALEQQVTGGESHLSYGSEGGAFADQIEEHMEVIGSDGEHVGTVDEVEGERIKLTRSDSGTDTDGGHRYLPIELVSAVEMGKVKLSTSAMQARARQMGS